VLFSDPKMIMKRSFGRLQHEMLYNLGIEVTRVCGSKHKGVGFGERRALCLRVTKRILLEIN